MERRRALSLGLAFVAALALALTDGVLLTTMAVRLSMLSDSAVLISLSHTLPPLGILLTLWMLPMVIARFGLVRCTLAAMLVSEAVILNYFLFSESFLVWLPLRFVNGLALGCVFVAAETWVNLDAPPERRGLTLTLLGGVMSAGFAAGPLLASLLPLGDPRTLLLAGALLLLAALPVALARRVAPAVSAARGDTAFSIFRMLRHAPWLFVPALVWGVAVDAYIGLSPEMLDQMGMGYALVPVLVVSFALGSLILEWPLGWLSDVLGSRRAVMSGAALGGALLSLAIALTLLGAVPFSRPLLFGLGLMLGGCVAAYYSLGLARIGDRFGDLDLMSASTAYTYSYAIGVTLILPLVGMAQDLSQGPVVLYMLAVFLAACALVPFGPAPPKLAGRAGDPAPAPARPQTGAQDRQTPADSPL